MRPTDPIKTMVQKLNNTTSAEMDQHVLTDALAALGQSEEPSATRPKRRRNMMQKRMMKLAAAAVLVCVVLIGTNQFTGSSTGVAWGEVVRDVEASPGVIFRVKQIHNDKERGRREFNMTVYGSREYGIRMDGYLDPAHPVQTYANPRAESLISIMHSSKTYERRPLTGDQLSELEEMDPKKSFKEILSLGYRELGRKIIDGTEAEGVEITNPEGARISSDRPIKIDSHVSQLWVSVKTNLPIFFEATTVCNNGALEFHVIQDEFQWEVALDASEFEPDIPADYTQVGKSASQQGTGTELRKWRFRGRDPQRGYLLVSDDGQASANIPESWADSPEHAIRVKQELDLQQRQGSGDLVGVREIEANGELDLRILMYVYHLSDGQTIRCPDLEPDDPTQWTVVGKRREELHQRRKEGKGQELPPQQRQIQGRVFTFERHKFVLSDGTEVIYSDGSWASEQ